MMMQTHSMKLLSHSFCADINDHRSGELFSYGIRKSIGIFYTPAVSALFDPTLWLYVILELLLFLNASIFQLYSWSLKGWNFINWLSVKVGILSQCHAWVHWALQNDAFFTNVCKHRLLMSAWIYTPVAMDWLKHLQCTYLNNNNNTQISIYSHTYIQYIYIKM